ncbi:hypothetical protein NC981_21620 [Leptolyngbya sp. DQ-M1]|uniref:hypothetical protein n=1 Tax=Leptolyngbya sp. DQ-M1 TaxID=2933920 RepID=UPI003299F69A
MSDLQVSDFQASLDDFQASLAESITRSLGELAKAEQRKQKTKQERRDREIIRALMQ